MRDRLIEVQAQGSGNWGVFLLWQFSSEESSQRSRIHPDSTVWGATRPPTGRDVMIFDLRTKEGALFDMSAELVPQLYRHQIHTCVLFEPFLLWLQEHSKKHSLTEIPDVVTLKADAVPPTEVLGWRHGEWIARLPVEALQYLDAFEKFALLGAVPPLPRSLALLIKKLLPNTSPQTAGDDEQAQILRGRGTDLTPGGRAIRERLGLR